MPYWVRTVYAGKCKEVKKYYSRRHKPKEKRIKREEPTRETQENVNIRKQTEQLRWKLNCNFQEGDMFVTFSYKKEERTWNTFQFKTDTDPGTQMTEGKE